MANIKIDFENGDKLHVDGIKESKVDELIEYFKNERADVKISKVPRLDSGIVEGIKGWENLKKTMAKAEAPKLSSEISVDPRKFSYKSTNEQQNKRTEYVKPEGEVVHNESDGFTISDSGIFDKAALKAVVEKKDSDEVTPSFYKTGIKETARGKKYRASYLCPECGDLGKHYIPDWVEDINCYNCDFRMKVKSVESIMGQNKDAFNNWYVAGKFLPKNADGSLVNPDLNDESESDEGIQKFEMDSKPLGQIFFEENEDGKTQKEIAAHYNVSASTVSRLIKKYLENEV